jgi:hypothetical protein
MNAISVDKISKKQTLDPLAPGILVNSSSIEL